MTKEILFQVLLTSALTAAIVTGLVSLLINWLNQKHENNQQDIDIAMKLLEVKDNQAKIALNQARKDGKSMGFTFYDPATQLSSYLSAMKEIRKTGKWRKGEESKIKYKQKMRNEK